MILRENKTLKTECTKTSNCCEEYARLQAENATLRAELKRWHENKWNDKINNPMAAQSTLVCHNCDHKDEYIIELESDLTRYRTAGAEGRILPKWYIFIGGGVIKADSAQAALEAQGSEAKPIYTEHDHEDYFTRKYRCGYCHAVLCQYNHGREWCDDGKNMVKPSTCPNCGRKVDWSKIEEAQTDEH